jgi:hypothetical protein
VFDRIVAYENLFNEITGKAFLPQYEVDKSTLAVKGRHIRPFDPKEGFKARPDGSVPETLSIDAKLLMLAAAKTELARSFDFSLAAEQAAGFGIRWKPLLIMDGGPLRLKPPHLFARKDFSKTFDSGRIGEAVGHLFMTHRGYTYWDHLPTLLEATLGGQQITHAERTRIAQIVQSAGQFPGEEPDYVYETQNGDVALSECKGSSVKIGEPYSADASVLRKGLNQLDAWAKLVRPSPKKQFAVGTFIRHDGDSNNEPSMIAWVDPPGEETETGTFQSLPSDAIKRGHYGALLALLGFVGPGQDLRLRVRRQTRRRPVYTIIINQRKFVIGEAGRWYRRYELLAPRFVIGLKVGLFEAFANALTDPTASLDVIAINREEVQQRGITGHILPDGTFIGELDERVAALADIETVDI